MSCVRVFVQGKEIDAGAHVIEDRTYCRLRDVCEALGARVSWTKVGDEQAVVRVEFPRVLEPSLVADLRLPSGVTADMVDRYCQGTPMEGLGKDFVAAEEKWRTNAGALAAIACHESDFGRSRIARDKRNLFGIRAYDPDPYNNAATYQSFQESIDAAARLLSVAYLSPAGKFHNGPHLAGIGKRWATDPRWAEKVLRHWRGIVYGM